MLLTLIQRRSIRIASVIRFSPAFKSPFNEIGQRKEFTSTSSIKDRDVFIFGEPTEPLASADESSASIGKRYSTFEDLGVCSHLSIALTKTEKTIPTIIQKASFASLVAKKDVVICAETGSGKTLAYLLPVLQQYFTSTENANVDSGSSEGGLKYPSTVIMVPNKELMVQVFAMAEDVLKHANSSSCRQVSCGCVERVDGHWPYRGVAEEPLTHAPDILICTPAFLGAFIKGPKILEENFFYSIKRCILDEADMLLEGSYKQDMEKIFDVFKVLRRRTMKRLDLKPHERVVQFILSAATLSTHGKCSVDQYLSKRFPRAERVISASFHKHHPRIEQEFLHVDLMRSEGDRGEEDRSYEDAEGNLVTVAAPVMTPARVELVFRALIGALPPRDEDEEGEEEEGDEGGGAPARDVVWHRDQWREQGGVSPSSLPPTMIFANTAGKARDLAAALVQLEGGLLAGTVAEFHKLVPFFERQAALEQFRRHGSSGVKVLVCTDAAARGLDLPEVQHVIQAEFALNVVQHMHRNGRASRAGRQGRATVIFDDSGADLVHAVLSSEGEGEGEGEGGRSIAQAFSRRRGFRRNLNRKTKKQDLRSQEL